MKIVLAILALLTCAGAVPGSSAGTLSAAGDRAAATLLRVYYAGNGLWRDCSLPSCHTENQDWGVDSATYTLYLRWITAHDAQAAGIARDLVRTATQYPAPCTQAACPSWSDVPEWDTIALMRDYEMLGEDRLALSKARTAFDFVEHSSVYALGACPQIHYQKPGGGEHYRLKTLETDANEIKAAVLLYEATHDAAYLQTAQSRYAAVRRYFLDPRVPLYSVYVFDDGRRCTQVPHRFFASVNGDMIWSGIQLGRLTHTDSYHMQAIATAKAVDRDLSDARGIYADLQAENDVEEPLVEAMYDLATHQRQPFARAWIVRNAIAAVSDRRDDGTFGRFFDGPPPQSNGTSIWASNGGLALEIAAAALAPDTAAPAEAWRQASYVTKRLSSLPATLTFDGSGIALIGAMGAVCCEPGRARVLLDGVETFDRTGIWQNKSMTGNVPDSVLFAWRWPSAGHHTIRLEGGVPDAKEGGPFLRLEAYRTLP